MKSRPLISVRVIKEAAEVRQFDQLNLGRSYSKVYLLAPILNSFGEDAPAVQTYSSSSAGVPEIRLRGFWESWLKSTPFS